MKELKSNIGWQIEKSEYNREFIRRRYDKTSNTISNWCTGKSYPSVRELFDLAELLGVNVEELYDRTDNKNN